jgi:hypothetical protein
MLFFAMDNKSERQIHKHVIKIYYQNNMLCGFKNTTIYFEGCKNVITSLGVIVFLHPLGHKRAFYNTPTGVAFGLL